jgi:cellulose synthase/poly-beta-1,6-N-acetylglucosamine synthase-like glycosyltransferase
MSNKPTVTIGISAYNEEANIKELLLSLLKQNCKYLIINHIIVISDNSTDSTELKVKSVKSIKIKLYKNKRRLGKALTLNKIINLNNSDYLVIIDADTLPYNYHLIENIIKPFSKYSNIGLVGGKVVPLPPKTFIESILYMSKTIKNEIFEKLSKGNNIYLCHGALRAFSKEFTHRLKFHATSSEDAYSYLKCISLGYNFHYEPSAIILYRLPNNLRDHLRQSIRFLRSKKVLNHYFSQNIIKESYFIPFNIKINALYKIISRNFIYAFLYFLILIIAKILSLFKNESKHLWNIAHSSKNLGSI